MDFLAVKPKRDMDTKTKFKTELCRNWTQGICEFGHKCTFAHGIDELRKKESLNDNYRTKKCKQFHELGVCQYGNRCQFKHVDRSPADIKQNEVISTASSSPREVSPAGKRRLPVFVSLSSRESNI